MKNEHTTGNLFTKRKPKPLVAKEAAISRQIECYLNTRKIWNIRVNSGKIQTIRGNWLQLAPKGTPDRLALYKGKLIGIEVKKLGEKPDETQLETHERMRRDGAIVCVAYSIDDVISVLKSIDNLPV